MNKRYKNRKNGEQGGYVLIIALIFFLIGGVVLIATMSDGVLREIKTVGNESVSKQSYFSSESALEDVVYRIKSGKQINSSETLSIASSTVVTNTSTLADGSKDIISSSNASTIVRKTEVNISSGNIVNLNYALQAGQGGIDIGSDVSIFGDMSTSTTVNPPLTQENIDLWKSKALTGGVSSSQDIGSTGANLGPEKINGDLSVGSGGTLNVSGVLWVTGNLTIDGSSTIQSADGSKSFPIIVDGTISISGGAQIIGSTGSRILLLSTNSGSGSISIFGGINDAVFISPYGTVNVSGGTKIRAIYANHISLSNADNIEYDSSVSSLNISSSSVLDASVNIKSWKEI